MTGQKRSRIAGIALVAAALLGIIAMAMFPGKMNRASVGASTEEPGGPPNAEQPPPADTAHYITTPERARIASPFAEPSSDSIAGRCAATVREQLVARGSDTSDVEIRERYGVRPPPGRGPDSLIVEGTARGSDTTRAVWHCAATSYPSGAVATLVAVIEDGWPGAAPGFDAAHAINLAAEDACLQSTKLIFPEYSFRGVTRVRAADTLQIRGDAMPFNTGDLAADFRCSAVVRGNRIVSTLAKAGK